MTINVKISLCKITRASKLFKRNYYLPLLRPLSPKDALRRKIITGQNVLGNRIEHYIPVLASHEDKLRSKRNKPKGVPIIKKRIKVKENEKYVAPFFDDNMENHLYFQDVLSRKGKEKDQLYVYEVPDKMYNLVISNLLEKAIKDKDIIDLTIAQRSEKIVLRLKDERRVVLPLAKWDGKGVLYRGSGWTKEYVEDEHHHGKDTMGMAKIFELKDSGVEDWELELMRMSSKRKKKVKGEDSGDWNVVIQAATENMDWDQFEEESKQVMDEIEEVVEEEDIPMEVDDMEKTLNVGDKLTEGGDEVLAQLPTMKEIPEVIKNLETGDLCELQNVSGVKVQISEGKTCFIAGQMVKTEENEVFVPGQTVEIENGTCEYTPGITVLMDDEPALIPGLVFGEEEETPVFLPGESTITEEGQLEFEVNEDDILPNKDRTSPPPKSRRDQTPPPFEFKPKVIDTMVMKEESASVMSFRPEKQALEDCLVLYEERRRQKEELERKRMKERTEEKIMKAESKVDTVRYTIRMKLKTFKVEMPKPYVALEPVLKSKKLEELERSVEDGTFEDDRTKTIMEKVRKNSRIFRHLTLMSTYGYDGEYGSGNIAPPK